MGRFGGTVTILALAAALAACGDDPAGGGQGGEGGGGGTGAGGTGGGEPVPHRFVTSSLRLPATNAEVRSLGFDLDGNGSIDNAIGSLLVFVGTGLPFGEAVDSGQLIQLHVLAAPSLVDAGEATWTVYGGEPTPEPDYSGNGSFTVAGGAAGAALSGAIDGGTFRGGPAAVPIELPVGEGQLPMALSLERVALQAAVTADGCDGKLGGAIPVGDFEETFVPGVAMALNAVVAADPGCADEPPQCSTEVEAILALLDTDGDRVITPEELLGNAMFTALVRPDVDLDGNGEKDAFGIGLGFTCVPASFDIP